MSILSELRRRNVFRVAALYVIVSWLVLQVADVFMSFLPLPEWVPNLVFVLLTLGFPVALVMAWAFELTPRGLQRETPVSERSAPSRAMRPVDFLLMGALLALGAYTFLSRQGAETAVTEPSASGPGLIESIVVLPLEDLTGEPDQAYFVAGMHEALITELSKIKALRVISRTSAMAYRDSDKPLPQIARELGVQAVIEGSVLRAGDKVRVTAQLIEAATDRHLWAENFDRQMTDILALYSEVARAIVDQVRVEVTPDEAARLVTERSLDPEVYELYLQGRYLCDNWSPQEMARGTEMLREVVRIDPTLAPAQAQLALCLQYRAFFNFVLPLRIHGESREAARKALELDPDLAEAHVAMAGIVYYLEYDRKAAERQLRQALELNPGSVKALIHLSWLLGESGRFEEGLEPTLKAIEYDPLNTVANHALGQLYLLDHQYEKALDAYENALALDPDDPTLVFSVAVAKEQLGFLDQALKLDRSAVELSGGASIFLGGYGYHLALSGATDEARQVLAQLQTPNADYPFDVAMVLIGLGEYDQAIDQLELAYEQRNSQLVYLPRGAWFDRLRDHPRFQALMQRIGW